ncbi:MAG TPA: error-prone DNA polymerase [Candidatus Acidoferrum sp.]|nr:error-prone DNA polymerase [Candidatus Acidoferrum sp.]
MSRYVELHARSAFSFLEGASVPEELAALAAEYEMPAMALLDRDGVYGSPRFHLAMNKASKRAHIGAEVTSPEGWRYPLLVESRAGYQNLCRLITQMKLRAKKGEGDVSPDEVAEKARGLFCLTGGDEGPLAHALAKGGTRAAAETVEQLCRIFGRDNVYVELQRHFHREEEARNHAAVAIARELRLPLLATNGVCYAQPQEREVLDVFTCIRNHVVLATAGRLLHRNSDRCLKTPAEMSRLFSDLPEAIANTEILSSRLEFTLKDLGYQFPKYPLPPRETEMSFLRKRTREGMIDRYGPDNEKARQQIDRELAMIEKLKLAGYFLIVWDIVRFCRENGILVQGRGSAANSAVCYSLGISAVDPVGMDLLFERFLSEERGEWPDIDIDLPSGDQRERAIQYVYERYGKLGAAMTANVITYRGRSAAREIGKALSFQPEVLDRLSSLVGTFEYRDSNDTLDRHFREAGLDLQNHQIRKFLELCVMVQDLPRHLGQHSGGMVVCHGQLDSIVPLEPATMPGRVVVQWDKEDCADMGIVKVDLLGLGMMAVLEDSIKIIRDDYKEEVDLAHLPAGDTLVYDTLCKADTVGMFQIESRAQMAFLPRLQPKCFYDIVVQVGIIRPGPIVGKMVHPYLKRRQKKEPPTCLHPSLEPVLERTLGVPLFQEQLLRMAMIAAGFSGGQAEELRRAMGFKRSERRMQDIEKKLRAGMEKTGIDAATQDTIVQSITSFALYGFPESHAASFALLAYASAYLKCQYLAAFTAALLNNQPMGFYRPATIVKDAQRHGLKICPIDVTCSDWACTLERHTPNQRSRSLTSIPAQTSGTGFPSTVLRAGGMTCVSQVASQKQGFALRLGLRYVKGLREEIAKEIVEQRAICKFSSIEDLKLRVGAIQKSELAALAEIGALNFIAGKDRKMHRRDALWQIERAARRAGPLFEANSDGLAREATNPGIPTTNQKPDSSWLPPLSEHSPLAAMTSEERLVADFRGTGMTVGPHPMAYHRTQMKQRGVRSAVELHTLQDGISVRIAGAVIARQRPGTANGFVFLSIEDETGIANAIITPQLFNQDRIAVVQHQFVMIDGKLQNQEGVVSVKAERVEPLAITRAEPASHDFH